MNPASFRGYGPVGTNAQLMPTTTGGGIPPKLDRVELTVIEYAVGAGSDSSDPVRPAWAFYTPDGRHIFTVDSERILAMTNSPGALIRSNCADAV